MARLIDADELIHSICRKCNDVNYDEPCEPSDCALYYAVHNAPTVDAVPVVHGRWIIDVEHLRANCSECGKILRFSDEMQIAFLRDEERFCYFCGAKMDLEVE